MNKQGTSLDGRVRMSDESESTSVYTTSAQASNDDIGHEPRLCFHHTYTIQYPCLVSIFSVVSMGNGFTSIHAGRHHSSDFVSQTLVMNTHGFGSSDIGVLCLRLPGKRIQFSESSFFHASL